jgi:hypothetical protein
LPQLEHGWPGFVRLLEGHHAHRNYPVSAAGVWALYPLCGVLR